METTTITITEKQLRHLKEKCEETGNVLVRIKSEKKVLMLSFYSVEIEYFSIGALFDAAYFAGGLNGLEIAHTPFKAEDK